MMSIEEESKELREAERELESQLQKWKKQLSKILDDERYDSIRVNDIEYNTLKIVGNAESYKDINPYLWNGGIDRVFENIKDKMKRVR
jgi:hypothetical protein